MKIRTAPAGSLLCGRSILWAEDLLETMADKTIRIGPLTRKVNPYNGKMDISVVKDTQVAQRSAS